MLFSRSLGKANSQKSMKYIVLSRYHYTAGQKRDCKTRHLAPFMFKVGKCKVVYLARNCNERNLIAKFDLETGRYKMAHFETVK